MGQAEILNVYSKGRCYFLVKFNLPTLLSKGDCQNNLSKLNKLLNYV